MKKDIEFPIVEGVKIAIVRQKNDSDAYLWSVYLLNTNEFPLENILVTSKGYGEINGESRNTSILRHLIEHTPAHGHSLIEPIDPTVFALNNEYWISYYVENKIYDKRFVFEQNSIKDDKIMFIKQLEKDGVLHE
jgi:hypothetical protein